MADDDALADYTEVVFWGPFDAPSPRGALLPEPPGPPRSLEEITRLIEVYPPSWRRWCDGPFQGGCACRGCVHWPAPSTVRGDPEGKAFPNPADRLSRAEVEIYVQLRASKQLAPAPTEQ
jgi:hypothetical protein